MHRLLPLAAIAGALILGGCGGSSTATTTDTGALARMSTVAVKHVDGMGDVLVDASGLALYTPDQESNGKIACTGKCTSFWLPLKAPAGAPTGTEKLDVIRRPDGTRQVALGAKPLYTFVQDAPGKITGEGFKDDFAGKRFTWHVVLAGGGKSDGGGTSTGAGGYGY